MPAALIIPKGLGESRPWFSGWERVFVTIRSNSSDPIAPQLAVLLAFLVLTLLLAKRWEHV